MPYTRRYEQALGFAARLHETQTRKGCDIPYISHLLAVSSLVIEHGGSEDEAIAGLLHDAIEDQGGAATGDLLRREFGDNVARIVEGCTDTDTLPKPPWRARKEAYIAHLASADASILLVSSCDKLHNARAILADFRVLGDALFERFTAPKAGTLWYYRALVTAFQKAGPSPVVEELDRVVTTLESLN